MDNMKLNLTMTVEELNVILEAISHLPYNRISGLVVRLQAAGQEQFEAFVKADASSVG